MGNFPGLMGPSKQGYLDAPVHRLEKNSGKPQRSETAAILAGDYDWKDRLVDSRSDLLANHNIGRRLLATNKATYLNGYLEPSNVRGRNLPTKSKMIKVRFQGYGPSGQLLEKQNFCSWRKILLLLLVSARPARRWPLAGCYWDRGQASEVQRLPDRSLSVHCLHRCGKRAMLASRREQAGALGVCQELRHVHEERSAEQHPSAAP